MISKYSGPACSSLTKIRRWRIKALAVAAKVLGLVGSSKATVSFISSARFITPGTSLGARAVFMMK